MTNLIDALHIPDTQAARDDRHLAIQRVVAARARPLSDPVADRRRGRATVRRLVARRRPAAEQKGPTCPASSPGSTRSTIRSSGDAAAAKARAWLALLVPTPAASRPRSRSS
jgi:hypothetical protein